MPGYSTFDNDIDELLAATKQDLVRLLEAYREGQSYTPDSRWIPQRGKAPIDGKPRLIEHMWHGAPKQSLATFDCNKVAWTTEAGDWISVTDVIQYYDLPEPMEVSDAN